MTDVFVTGGSGYIGRALLRQLAENGDHVSALARSDAAAALVRGLGATAVHGDLTDTAVLRASAARADAVVHLGQSGGDTAAVDLAAAEAMLEGAGSRPYVHTGGLWTLGATDGVADETAPRRPPRLTAWRVENERQVMDRAAHGGHPVLVMPAVVYGLARGLVQSSLVDRAADRVVFPGDGANRWGLVQVDDVAQLYLRAIGAPAGESYLGVTQCVPVGDLARAVARAPGNPQTAQSESVQEFTDRLGPLAEALLLDQQLTGDKARRELGWAPTRLDAVEELARG